MAVGLSVIAPCLNEQDNVGVLAERVGSTLSTLRVSAELILVDDGSTDETWLRICEQSARDPRIGGVRHGSNQGIEAAWRSGLSRATGEFVCLIDADLQNAPEDIARLYQALVGSDSADLVQAVRRPAEGVRRLAYFSRALNVLLNVSFGMRMRDNKSGFILCRREVLADLLTHRYRYRYFQSFIGVAAGARGYRVAEVDTVFHQRHAGRSFLSAFPIGVSLRILAELIKVRVDLALPRRNVAHSRSEDLPAVRPSTGQQDVEQWNDQFSREHDIDDYYTASSLPIRWIEGRRLTQIRAMLDVRPQDRVLEVGCGGGHVLQLFGEAELTGVDVSGAMLERARRNLQGRPVTLLKGELHELDLPSASFDKIVCTEVLEHTVDPAAVLEEISRLVRPEGRVVITFPNDRLILRVKRLLHQSRLTSTPWFRRVSWGADDYHLHVWSVGEMRSLLERHFAVTNERFVPSSLLPIRCCFLCEPRATERRHTAPMAAET